MPTTIDSAGITFNDATSLTSANIGTAQLVNGSVTASKLGTTEQKQICKAWVNFDGTTSPGTIRSSYNISSVTKNGTGDYTVNFATAMSDANYSIITGPTEDVRLAFSLESQTTSNFRINKGGLLYVNGGTMISDCAIVPISIFGN
jgi:hypothetical protein